VIAFIRRQGRDADTARELAHEFFAGVLEGDAIGGANRVQGRFRSYLLGAVKHFLAHRWEADRRLRRGAGVKPLSLDDENAPALEIPDHEHLTPEAAFDRQWAVTVLARAMDALRRECEAANDGELFERARPWLAGEAAHGEQSALAAGLGMSAGALKVAVHRLKQRYRQLLKAEIASTLRDSAAVEEEMRALFVALGG
jgi:RNA polymerase sigma-70 factor (ECF subfamily)